MALPKSFLRINGMKSNRHIEVALLALAVALVTVPTGCESRRQKPPEVAAEQASTPKPQVAPPKYSLLDNDPKYVQLRRLRPWDLLETLPAYEAAVEKREALIRARVGNISDPALYKTLSEDAGKSIPQVKENDYYELAEAELQRRRKAYAEAHKDDYFMVGTYENYFPSIQKAVFNLLKPGTDESAQSFAQTNFGSAVNDVGVLGKPVDEYHVISEDRYKPDALEECWVLNRCDRALVIPVTAAQMDGAYAAVTRRWGPQIESVYADEMRAGGDHPSYAEGRFISHSGNPEYLRAKIRSYFRRQSIWILGRGDAMDPAHVKVREAYLVVGDEEFGRIK